MKCPQCSAEVENQTGFGMVECPNCHHVSMFMATEGAGGEEVPRENELPRAHEAPMESAFSDSPDTENFDDVAEFGNSEVDSGGASALFYDIEISGIDTPELRMELQTVLEDKKLNLPASSTLPKIKEGVLLLRQLHPVRAAVLVSQLRTTHLKVKWSTDQMIKAVKTLVVVLLGVFSLRSFASSWEYHDQSLKSYAIRINNLQDDIHEAILKKNAEPDLKKKEEYLEDIKKKYSDLRGMYKDFLKEMEHVRYEHPERGDKVERQYVHLKVKTLEELENDNTLDGQLSRLKRKAEMKYQPQPAPAPSATSEKK